MTYSISLRRLGFWLRYYTLNGWVIVDRIGNEVRLDRGPDVLILRKEDPK